MKRERKAASAARVGCFVFRAYVPMKNNGEKEESSPKFLFLGGERGFCLVTGSPAKK